MLTTIRPTMLIIRHSNYIGQADSTTMCNSVRNREEVSGFCTDRGSAQAVLD